MKNKKIISPLKKIINFVKTTPSYYNKLSTTIVEDFSIAKRNYEYGNIMHKINLMNLAANITEKHASEDTSIVARKIGIRMANFCSSKGEFIEYISKLLNDACKLSEDTTSPFASYFESKHVQYTINFLEKLKTDDKMIDEISYYLSLPEDSLKELRDMEELERSLAQLRENLKNGTLKTKD